MPSIIKETEHLIIQIGTQSSLKKKREREKGLLKKTFNCAIRTEPFGKEREHTLILLFSKFITGKRNK